MELVPDRLRGETASFDIEANGKVYVERLVVVFFLATSVNLKDVRWASITAECIVGKLHLKITSTKQLARSSLARTKDQP